jgi:NitT/TauT family transport system substrate-binding protein
MKSFGRRAAAAAFVALALGASSAWAQALEKTKIHLGVGGKALLYYLPLTVAEKKGFFKDQGLDVEISDFAGGAKSLQGLVGGSLDVVTGAYEHTIRMQAKGQDIRAVVELGRFPGIVLGVKKGVAYNGPADLKGKKIGVTAPGSSTNMLVNFVLAQGGLTPQDASFVGVGSAASAVAAIQKGEIEAISHLEPVISMLERDGSIRVVVDTRTEEGTRALFGGANPAAVLYAKADFIEKNPNATQALVNALVTALKWIQRASPEEIAAVVPEEYLLGDKSLYVLAVSHSKPSYSLTGVIDPQAMQSAADMLTKFDPELKDAQVDLSKTFVDRFAKKADATIK